METKKKVCVEFISWVTDDVGILHAYYRLPSGITITQNMLPKCCKVMGYVPLEKWIERQKRENLKLEKEKLKLEQRRIMLIERQRLLFLQKLERRKLKRQSIDIKLGLHKKIMELGFNTMNDISEFCKKIEVLKNVNPPSVVVSRDIVTIYENIIDKPMDLVIPKNSIVKIELISFKSVKVKHDDKIFGDIVITLDRDIARNSLITIDTFICILGKELYQMLLKKNIDEYVKDLTENKLLEKMEKEIEKTKTTN